MEAHVNLDVEQLDMANRVKSFAVIYEKDEGLLFSS